MVKCEIPREKLNIFRYVIEQGARNSRALDIIWNILATIYILALKNNKNIIKKQIKSHSKVYLPVILDNHHKINVCILSRI